MFIGLAMETHAKVPEECQPTKHISHTGLLGFAKTCVNSCDIDPITNEKIIIANIE